MAVYDTTDFTTLMEEAQHDAPEMVASYVGSGEGWGGLGTGLHAARALLALLARRWSPATWAQVGVDIRQALVTGSRFVWCRGRRRVGISPRPACGAAVIGIEAPAWHMAGCHNAILTF